MKWTHWILYLICLPWDLLVGWPIVIGIRLFWGEKLRRETPPPYDYWKGGGGGWCLTTQFKPGARPVNEGGWYWRKKTKRPWGGTTLGHAIFYGPNGRKDEGWSRTQAHEHIHVEQFEVAMLRSFFVGLLVGIVLLALGHYWWALGLFLGIWTTGYLLMGAAGWLTAILRGEEAYHGATHEESARAQDDSLMED